MFLQQITDCELHSDIDPVNKQKFGSVNYNSHININQSLIVAMLKGMMLLVGGFTNCEYLTIST